MCGSSWSLCPAWKHWQVWQPRGAPISLQTGWCLSAAAPWSSNKRSPELPSLIWRDIWLTVCFTWGISLPTCHSDMKIWAVSSWWYHHHFNSMWRNNVPSSEQGLVHRFFSLCWITLICFDWGWMKRNVITVFSTIQSTQRLLSCFRPQVKWIDFYELTLSCPCGWCQGTVRQLSALHKGWQSWQWDSSKEEFPEGSRSIQIMKKVYRILHYLPVLL